jgi:hypothetical protein
MIEKAAMQDVLPSISKSLMVFQRYQPTNKHQYHSITFRSHQHQYFQCEMKACIAQSVFEGFIGAWNDAKWFLNAFAIVVGSVVFTLLPTNSLHVKEQPDDEFFIFTNNFYSV